MRRVLAGIATIGTIAGMTAVAPAATAGKPPPSPTSVVQFSPSGTALSATEGQASAVSVVVTRSSSAGTATFNLDAIPGSATAADYSPGWSNPVTIDAGSTSRTLLLNIVDDTLTEPTESMQLKLTNPAVGTQIGKKNTATVTIYDNDPCSPLSVNDSSSTEGSPMTFTVSMAAVCSLPVQVHWATSSSGDATPGVDYASPQSGNVAIASGATSTTFSVTTIQDTTDEPDQTFNVLLSAPVNTTIADGTGVGTINDDDAAPTVVMSDNPTVVEGNALVYTISLSALSEKTASGTFETWSGNAPDPRYTRVTSGAWSISPGNLSTTVSVSTTDDADPQTDTTVWAHLLAGPTNATIPVLGCGDYDCTLLGTDDAWSYGTLQDNDNGGLENALAGWSAEQTGAGPVPTSSTAQFHSGAASALLGTDGVSGDEPGDGFSYLYRTVSVPAGRTTTLSVWVLEHGDNNNAGDDQFLQVKIPGDPVTVLATPFQDGSTFNGSWQQKTFDLSAYAGQSVVLLFGVHQDITGGDPTAMWVDDLVLSYTP